ncbi:MAG: lipopolysaccharide biosynthesis protein [Clostridium baratii]|uniref:lipopolysaccharide biosynthesis protein n=1 Tax=Clostridium baratii TaxID=1561 RepID=UPI00242CF8BB|nr:lipopolysaccharide biosynthesis protein [Clostridium baratii]MBS6041963.1 lipopolysaccharide biosynthesis protein [Clostridium baratii]
MEQKDFKGKLINATKWSTITEIAAKLITPITNMILARIISPQAFGVVATVTMIMSFSDMFSDAGFQKYLIQHNFKNETEMFKNANVAFWTNLGISITIWILIIIFREQIAILVGNPGLGNVIAVACVQLILTSFSSIQMAIYRREFDFKTLFWVRIIGVFIPIIITIPLAFMGLSYWSLIIGSIVMQFSNTMILTIKSKWKPQKFYSIEILKDMFSFSVWSLIEAISIWFTAWIDVFIVSSFLNDYYLGLYKTSTTMINGLMALITSAIIPVFFATISRLQDSSDRFNKVYFKTQRLLSLLLFPMGIGVYLYRDLATKILLGDKWSEASNIIGIWALISVICIVFGNLSSEVYRAKGRPKLSFVSQSLFLIVFVPICIISVKHGFWTFIYARSLIRLEAILVDLIIMKYAIGISPMKIVKNLSPSIVASICMFIFGYLLKMTSDGIAWDALSIVMCALFYFGILYLFPSIRNEMKKIVKLKLDNTL